MNIQINGEQTMIDRELTVAELLTEQKVKMPDMVSVELNGAILNRAAFDTTTVTDGDAVEFLYFMGGGQ